MSRPIHPNYDQATLLPPCVEDWVSPRHPARFVRDFVGTLDLSALGFRDSPGDDGRPHLAFEMLLAVWLFGWMDRTRSLRRLEKACLECMPYIWLSGNLQPDHNTLWRFFRDNKAQLRKLFKRIVQVADEAGLVGFALHAIDGTKIQAACSTDTALHRERLAKELIKLDALIDSTIAAVEQEAAMDEPGYAMPEQMQDTKQRREAIRQALATVERADTEHLHPTEPEARMMKARQGTRMGYNAQIAVDHDSDLIVAESVVQDQNDTAQAIPVLNEVLENTGRVADTTDLDGGYFSGEQLDEAERRGYDVLVPIRQDNSTKQGFAKADFKYDRELDVFICPQGKALEFSHEEKPSKTERYPRSWYRCSEKDCPVRDKCTKDKRGRTVKRTSYDDAIERQKAQQEDPTNRNLMKLRKEIVEHPFGIIKAIDGFGRFTVRGLGAVNAQWALVCSAYNLRKMYAFWLQGETNLGGC
jgi:transposase